MNVTFRHPTGRNRGPLRRSVLGGADAPPISREVRGGRVLLCAGAAAGALLAAGEATGLHPWDGVLRVALAALVTWAGSRADRVTVAILALSPIPFLLHSLWLIPALVGGLLAFAYLWTGQGESTRRLRDKAVLVPAAISAIGLQGLLRMNADWFFGFESLLAGMVTVAVLVAGWRGATPQGRRLGVRLGGGSIAVVLVVLLGAAALLQSGRDAAADGVFAAEGGLAATREGDVDRSRRLLNLADNSFTIAGNRLDSVWVRPAELVPIVSQNIRAARTAVAAGADLSVVAAEVSQSLDFTVLSGANGRIDLDALQAAGPRLEDAVGSLTGARQMLSDVDDRWLVGSLAKQISSANADLAEAQNEAERAGTAARVLPSLLGADRPQRYFVAFGSPAEARELGGLLARWALVEFDDGSLRRVTEGRIAVLLPEVRNNALEDPDGYPAFFESVEPATFFQNVTSIPDLAEVARAIKDLLPTLEGAPLDGVVYVDPYGLGGILEVAGPVQPEGTSLVLDATNTTDFLLRDQYIRFEEPGQRHSVLGEVVREAFDNLSTVQLPPPGRLAQIFGPLGRGKRLQMVTFDAETNDFLREIDLLNDFPWPDENDFLSVTSINTGLNKLDAWLERDVRYEAGLDAETGDLIANLRVTVTSTANQSLPSYIMGPERDGLQPGDHRTQIVIWTPHELNGAEVDGEPVPAGSGAAYGFNRHTVTVTVAPGETREVLIGLAGQIAVPEDYNLILAHYPGATIDDFAVRVVRSDGIGVEAEFPMVEDVYLSLSRPDEGPLPY